MRNVLVLTGDVHSSWAYDVPRDPWSGYDPRHGTGTAAVEIVTPAVSSPTGSITRSLDHAIARCFVHRRSCHEEAVLGLVLGGILGVFDGLTALISAPEVAPDIVGIVIGSTFKGVIVGVLAGWFANRVRSIPAGVVVGLLLGAFFAFLVAAMPTPDGKHYYWEIILPGSVVGMIVGYATQRDGAASRQAAMAATR